MPKKISSKLPVTPRKIPQKMVVPNVKSLKPVVVQPTVSQEPLPPLPTATKTEAEKIWEAIKSLKMEIFSLPNQFVQAYYKPIFVDPVKLHLLALTKASAAFPALEVALSPKYKVTLADRFIVVELAPLTK